MIYKRSIAIVLFRLLVLLGCVFSTAGSRAGDIRIRRICIAQNGTVTVNWYDYTDTCQGVRKIYIYGKPVFGSYSLVDSITGHDVTSYAIANGSKYLGGAFYIKYITKCLNQNVILSDTMPIDSTPPPVTNPDSVSVLANGAVVVGWSANPTKAYADTKSFIINNVKGNRFFPVDTILRNQGLMGEDRNAGANGGPVSYCLSGVDSCDNVAPLGESQTTAFLSDTQDSCRFTVTLSWSGYEGWRSGVRNYELFISRDSSKGYKMVGTVAGLSYTFDTLKNFTKYFFFVRAIKDTSIRVSSSSNRIGMTTEFQSALKYVYIKTVTVQADGIEVDWTTSDNPQIAYFEVYKGHNIADLSLLAQVNASTLINGQFSYVDKVSSLNDVWYYFVKAYNTCGHFAGESNKPHSIVLDLKKTGRIKDLSWNKYDNWNGGVAEYEIIRSVADSVKNVGVIGTVGSGVGSFTDLDSFSGYGRPGVCYQIEAIENGDSDAYGFKETSYSNEVCFVDAPIVYIPNAFAPIDGLNYIFRPVVSFTDTTQSEMDIYNRWGELIFKTNDVTKGWDGRMKNGQFAPEGIYEYYIKLYGLDYSFHAYNGTVTLL